MSVLKNIVKNIPAPYCNLEKIVDVNGYGIGSHRFWRIFCEDQNFRLESKMIVFEGGVGKTPIFPNDYDFLSNLFTKYYTKMIQEKEAQKRHSKPNTGPRKGNPWSESRREAFERYKLAKESKPISND